ncbi:2'-deoxymugineic-acid 2'-dioxygenase-like [Silene latifolia]|uniref:2'-deoxymugineic-acid 2'-dioxygenase-like n=1 Tax=Silene latifolia TaxID=37657 RepID=UPI003D7769A3
MGLERSRILGEVYQAARGGIFQVTNHSIPVDVMRNAMTESTRFFELPEEQINAYMALVENEPEHWLYTSSMMNRLGGESNHFWRDALTLNCDGPRPTRAWPSQPPNFRRAVWEFASEVRVLQERILDLMIEGLGPERNYFGSRNYNGLCFIVVNRYPRCPEPTLAIGMPPHGDSNLLTISIPTNGLQIWQDREFKYVVPSSNALPVTVGRQLEIVTGIDAPGHRVVVNSQSAQTSLSFFAMPTPACEVTQAPNIPRESRYIDGVPFCEFIVRVLPSQFIRSSRSCVNDNFCIWSPFVPMSLSLEYEKKACVVDNVNFQSYYVMFPNVIKLLVATTYNSPD